MNFVFHPSNGTMWHPSNPLPENGLGRSDSVRRSHWVSSSKSVFALSTLFGRKTCSRILPRSEATSGTSFARARSRLLLCTSRDPNIVTRSPTFMPASSAGDSFAIPFTFANGRFNGAEGELLLSIAIGWVPAGVMTEGWPSVVIVSRFCDRFSNESFSPPATPETDPSQFLTTHFPVTGSYFGRGFGERRRCFSSDSSFVLEGFYRTMKKQ